MRCYITEYHGDNKATFECPCGHKFRTHVIPPKRYKGRMPGEEAIRMFARFWRKENNGVTMDCPKCKKLEAAQ